jgi:hypothetical protein
MITANQIREYLQAKPFKPFLLFLSDGSSHEVPHPEFAWVFGSTVFVGVAGKSTKAPEDFVKQISIEDTLRARRRQNGACRNGARGLSFPQPKKP